jgi:hypothetical protein
VELSDHILEFNDRPARNEDLENTVVVTAKIYQQPENVAPVFIAGLINSVNEQI